MNDATLQSFLSNVTQLTEQHEALKKAVSALHKENDLLKQENSALLNQNSDAKIALHQIINQLKEMQA